MDPQQNGPSSMPYYLLFTFLAGLFFLPFIGALHLLDWDEINFASIAWEMASSGEYLQPTLNYIPFTEKPPLFFWLQSLFMGIFGKTEWAARLPNAIAGIITLPLLYGIGRKLINHRFGFYWALAYLGSTLPHIYFKSGLIDPVFNLFIFVGFYYLLLLFLKKQGTGIIDLKHGKYYYPVMAGVFCGLAILAKGPVALLIICLALGAVWLIKKFRFFIHPIEFLVFLGISVLVAASWYGIEALVHGPEFVTEFTVRQWELLTTPDAGHGGFPGFHIAVLLLGCFPASVFAIKGHFSPDTSTAYERNLKIWMIAFLWMVLILFSIVQSKIIHYSSAAYFPLTFLTALGIMHLLKGQNKFIGLVSTFLVVLGGIYITASTAIFIIGQDPGLIALFFSNDPFAAKAIGSGPGWGVWTMIPAFIIAGSLIYYFVQKKKNQLGRAFKTLFIGHALAVAFIIIYYFPRIEMITQNEAVEFVSSKSSTDSYLRIYGYKSYIGDFYFDKSKNEIFTLAYLKYRDKILEELESDWSFYRINEALTEKFILTGPIDKTAYLITKEMFVMDFRQNYPEFEEIYSKNGFYFFKKEPKGP